MWKMYELRNRMLMDWWICSISPSLLPSTSHKIHAILYCATQRLLRVSNFDSSSLVNSRDFVISNYQLRSHCPAPLLIVFHYFRLCFNLLHDLFSCFSRSCFFFTIWFSSILLMLSAFLVMSFVFFFLLLPLVPLVYGFFTSLHSFNSSSSSSIICVSTLSLFGTFFFISAHLYVVLCLILPR